MNSDQEISFLLQLIKNPTDKNLQRFDCRGMHIIYLAKKHKLIYQLLSFAKSQPNYFPDHLMKQVEQYNQNIAMSGLLQLKELKRLASFFQDNQIGFATIKGPQLSRMLYGRQSLKESLDLDLILIHKRDLTKVHNLLSNAGYALSNLNDYSGKIRRKLFLIAKREISYFNPATRIAIDLHIRPGANTYLTEHRFDDFFQRLKPFDLEGTSVTVLSDEAYFVYLCYHGALHQFSRLAWLADIRAFLKLKSTSMNLQEIKAIAGKWRVTNCVNLALILIKIYFEEDYLPLHPIDSWRMKFMAGSCKKVLYRSPGYGITIRGRLHKSIYMQFLLEGVAARIDWFYGMLMRKGVPLLSEKVKLG